MGQSWKDIAIGLFVFAAEIFLFYFLWKNNMALTVSLLTVSFFVLLGWANKEERLVYFVGFFLGPIVDLSLVPTGIWSYGNPTIFGVPPWLPIAYGLEQ